MAKRFYELRFKSTDEPAYLEHVGSVLKLSGLMLQGMGLNILLVSPTSEKPDELEIVKPSLEEWCEILRQSDDPVFFDKHAGMKALVRKQQYAISGAVQQKVWVRDDFQCLYCGADMKDGVQMTVDHWIPLEEGGRNEMANYITACRLCNKRKGSMSPEQWCRQQGLDQEGLERYLEGKMSKLWIAHL